MILSATQLKTYKRCPRLWWFEKVIRLPQAGGVTYGKTFGNVLHATVERWLKADDQGRDEYGDPVEIYPEGWTTDEEGGTLEPGDDEKIKTLVSEAIESGKLRRDPGRLVEHGFTSYFVQGEGWGNDVAVVGKIDLVQGDTITDHKGAKSTRYAGSEDPEAKSYLGDDDQMLLYAYKLVQEGHDPVKLRHLTYVREGTPRVIERQVSVPADKILERYFKLQDRGKEMRDLKSKGLSEFRWRYVPGALDSQPAECNAFGGCQFIQICMGRETVKKYRRRMRRLRMEGDEVTLAEILAARKAGAAPAAAQSAPVNPVTEPVGVVEAPEGVTGKEILQQGLAEVAADTKTEEEPQGAAPVIPPEDTNPVAGADSNPPAGSLSRSELKKRKKDVLIDTILTLNQELEAYKSDYAANVYLDPDTKETEVEKLQRELAEAKALAGQLRKEAEAAATVTSVYAEKPADLILLVNAVPGGGTGGVSGVALSQLIEDAVKSGGDTMETFYKADGFKRRDALCGKAQAIVDSCRGKFGAIVAFTRTAEERALAAALEPLVDAVVVGVSS